MLLVDLRNRGLMLHHELAVGKEHDALLLVARQLELFLDDGEHLIHLEGVGHEEPKRQRLILLCPLLFSRWNKPTEVDRGVIVITYFGLAMSPSLLRVFLSSALSMMRGNLWGY